MNVFALQGMGRGSLGGALSGEMQIGWEVGRWVGAEGFRRVGLGIKGGGLCVIQQRIFLKATFGLVGSLELFLGFEGPVQRYLGFFESVENF